MYYKPYSSSILNSNLRFLNEAKKSFLTNSLLRLNVSGKNFCKTINISLNSPYCCATNWKTESFTPPHNYISINMSLKPASYTCGTAKKPRTLNQSNFFFKIQSPFNQPMAQHLLAHLLSGLSNHFSKEQKQAMQPKQSSSSASTSTGTESVLAALKSENINTVASDSHPINLGCPYWSNRKRNISEQSDNIYFLYDDSNNDNCEFNNDEGDGDSDGDDDSSIPDLGTLNEAWKDEMEYLESCTYEDPKNGGVAKKKSFNAATLQNCYWLIYMKIST
ncbi:uncharacterized protein PPP1R15 isoform X2 [Eurosta solidaginis]|uniref:uncharacterized protein PPP1R15 isoform X2 n=1 Tax=Eurosta solidaginis TaxID=178769 RepID=UPI0035310850